MSWNSPFSWNYNRSSRDQLNTDRFSIIFDYMADMRRRMENSEQLINTLTTRIETLETNDNNIRNPPSLFNFEPREPRPLRRNRNTRTTPRTYTATYNFMTPNAEGGGTGGTDGTRDNITPLVDNIFNGILLDTITNTRLGLSIEQLNTNTITELFVGNDSDIPEEDREACSICREPFANSSIIRKINSCGHKFHLNCIDTWFQNQYTCPMCRVSVRIIIPRNNTTASENDDNDNDNDNDNENMPRLITDNF